MSVFLEYYLYTILFFVFLFVSGGLIRSHFCKSFVFTFRNLFFNTLISSISIITCYSCFVTSGNTINILYLIIGACCLYLIPSKKKETDRKDSLVSENMIKNGIICLSVLTIIFFYYFSYIYDYSTGTLKDIHRDFFCYARDSITLNQGFENTFHTDNDFLDVNVNMPYHYYEIWLNALIYKVFGLNATLSYMLITFTSVMTIYYAGLAFLVQKYIGLTFKGIILSVLLLFIMQFTPLLLEIHPLFAKIGFFSSPVAMMKSATISLFFLSFLILYKEKKQYSYLALFCLPIINVLTIPAIMGTVSVYILYKSRHKQFLYIPSLLVVVSCAVFAYFTLQSNYNAFMGEESIPFSLDIKALRLYITLPVAFFLGYIAYFFIFYIIDREKVFTILKRGFPVYFLSIFFCVSFNLLIRYKGDVNTGQVYGLVIPSLMNALISVMTIRFYSISQKSFTKGILFLILGFNLFVQLKFNHGVSCYNQDEINFQRSIATQLKDTKLIKIGYITNKSFYTDVKWMYRPDHPHIFGKFLLYQIDECFYYSLDDHKSYSLKFLDNPFMKYYYSSGENINDARWSFMEKNNIEYLIVKDKEDIGIELFDNLDLLAENSTSGESFFRIKKKN